MPPVATAEQPQLADGPAAAAAFEPRETFEDVLVGAWQELVIEGRTACLVCGGAVTADCSCASCGSELR